MTLDTKIKQVIDINNALQETISKSSTLILAANEKIAELEERISPEAIPELKEIQLISLGAQAEIFENLQENMLIMFGALADIFETLEELL